MIEQVFDYYTGDDNKVQKLIMDENINYIHMTFNDGEGLPEHYSNSNVYMTVLRGKLSIELDDQEEHVYPKGKVLQIPYKTKMNVRNKNAEVLELLVVKSPAPKNYKE
jgi:quercetin dioxygenase-like cupin family protein